MNRLAEIGKIATRFRRLSLAIKICELQKTVHQERSVFDWCQLVLSGTVIVQHSLLKLMFLTSLAALVSKTLPESMGGGAMCVL